jgi:minichromosome maintenance protein 10
MLTRCPCFKLDALEAVRAARKDPELGPKPGPRIRSGVAAPTRKESTPSISTSTTGTDIQPMYDLDDSADDDVPEKLSTNNVMDTKEPIEEKMVDLDDL